MRLINLALLYWLSMLAFANAQALQTFQNALFNIEIVVTQGDQTGSSQVESKQNGVLNWFFGIQDAKNLNSVNVNQTGALDDTRIVQQGTNNVAVNLQNSRQISGSSAPAIPVPLPNYNRGPVYIAEQTNQGYLSYFSSGEISIVTLTTPGLTAIGSFGRSH